MNLYDSKTYLNDLCIAAQNTINFDKLHGKNILVTGATGTIGSFLVDVLVSYTEMHHANIKIFAASRNIERLKARFSGRSAKPLFLEHDLSKPITFNNSVDYIIHTAGNAHPNIFYSDPVGTIIGNITGTYELLNYATEHNAERLLYISTGEVYGNSSEQLIDFDENYSGGIDSTSVRACYPNSKRAAETLCVAYAQNTNLSTVIVRPCHTYGPCMTSEDSRAHAQFFRDVLENRDIIMTSEGSQVRSYCYIADCASVILTALINGQNGEAYNSANPNSIISIAGFAHMVAEKSNKKVVFKTPTNEDISKRSAVTRQVLSSIKTESLGWQGYYSLEKGVSNTLSILREAKGDK